MKKRLVFFVFFMLMACSMHRDEARVEDVISWNKIDFEDTTVFEVQKALAKVFILSQGPWFYISPNRTGMRVRLTYKRHFGLGYIKRSTVLDYTFRQENKKVLADTIYNDQYVFDFLLCDFWEPEGPIHNPALHDLILKRANYLLGKSDKWYTCEEYEAYMDKNGMEGSIAPLCFFAYDYTPDSPEGLKIIQDVKI